MLIRKLWESVPYATRLRLRLRYWSIDRAISHRIDAVRKIYDRLPNWIGIPLTLVFGLPLILLFLLALTIRYVLAILLFSVEVMLILGIPTWFVIEVLGPLAGFEDLDFESVLFGLIAGALLHLAYLRSQREKGDETPSASQ